MSEDPCSPPPSPLSVWSWSYPLNNFCDVMLKMVLMVSHIYHNIICFQQLSVKDKQQIKFSPAAKTLFSFPATNSFFPDRPRQGLLGAIWLKNMSPFDEIDWWGKVLGQPNTILGHWEKKFHKHKSSFFNLSKVRATSSSDYFFANPILVHIFTA